MLRNNINYYHFIDIYIGHLKKQQETLHIMSSTAPNRHINTMLQNLTITTKKIAIYHTQQKISTYYEDKIFSAIKCIRDTKQRPDLDAIFKHIAKNEA